MRAVSASRYVVFLSIVAVGCLADLATKSWMFDWLGSPPYGRISWVWENVFGFQTSLNEGALFGIGQGRVTEFAILSVVVVVGIVVWLFCFGAARDWVLTVALGCAVAGILGNLYDRVGLPGLLWEYANPWHEVGEPVYAVRDWILVMIGPIPWPNFNIADSLMVCGAALFAWHAIFVGEEEKDEGQKGRDEGRGTRGEE